MTIQKVAIIGEESLVNSIADKIRENQDVQLIVKGSLEEIISSDMQAYDLVVDTHDESKHQFVERLVRIEQRMSESAVLSAYHTGVSVTEIVQHLKRPDRFVGLHFFRLGKLTKLVEVVAPEKRDVNQNLVKDICSWLEKADFVPVPVKDRPGLLAYRLMIPYLNQAAQAFDDGIATNIDIDNSVRLGLGYPVGPLERLDQLGIDQFIAKAQDIYAELPERKYAVPPIIRRMKAAGCLGEKSGEGFYNYEK